MTSTEIELAVAQHFDWRQNLIVPNVSWGIGLNYEADIVVLRPSGYAIEIEIKISKQDIKKDLQKCYQHSSDLFREVWFAVPDHLKDDPNIPAYAGILSVFKNNEGANKVKVIRRGQSRYAFKWDAQKRNKLMELGAMRIWSLKEHISAIKTTNNRLSAAIQGVMI